MAPDPPRREVRDIKPRCLNLSVWHHCPPDVAFLSVTDPPLAEGRYHRKGGPPVWYGSSHERGAWAELLRHRLDPVDALHERRRIGKARVAELLVIDLTDVGVRDALGVKEADLKSDDYAACQRIAEEARVAGLDGIVAPSAAMKGEHTLIVFRSGIKKLTEEHSRVQHPPVSMLDMLVRILLPKRARNALSKLRRRYRRR